MLERPITLRQFEALPFVRSLFFRYGLSFTDPNLRAIVKKPRSTCMCLQADRSGAATISITMSTEALNSLIFHYNLK
ncbi:unnamed protein product [Gongylonema pulchrum]|uniref:KY-like immunoglobulin-like domain-containing protein n=1 Tax=Gongylonema pulchrum TaxID=637853 RepID=A0A3P7MDJ4_9BILA|nr:unnamed protein product [Gongylonema pulchrum]